MNALEMVENAEKKEHLSKVASNLRAACKLLDESWRVFEDPRERAAMAHVSQRLSDVIEDLYSWVIE